jgi:hypothetical protein
MVTTADRQRREIVHLELATGKMATTPLGWEGGDSIRDLALLPDGRLCVADATVYGVHFVYPDGAIDRIAGLPVQPWRIGSAGDRIGVACHVGIPRMLHFLFEIGTSGELLEERNFPPGTVAGVPLAVAGGLGFVLEREEFVLYTLSGPEEGLTLFPRALDHRVSRGPGDSIGTSSTLLDAAPCWDRRHLLILCTSGGTGTPALGPVALVRVAPGEPARVLGIPEPCERFVVTGSNRIIASHSSLRIPTPRLMEFEVPNWDTAPLLSDMRS